MPEYLAPAVYVEETSFRAKSIEGVSTSTTAFAGPTRKGPTGEVPEILTSFGDFERVYGGFGDLNFGPGNTLNFVAHAVKNYFDNGGSRLFIARVFLARAGDDDGQSRSAFIGADGDNANNLRFEARTPGAVGDGTAILSLSTSEALNARALERAPQGTLLNNDGTLFLKTGETWADAGDTALGALVAGATFISLNVLFRDAAGNEYFYENMGFAPTHPRFAGSVLAQTPSRRIEQLENPYNIDLGTGVTAFRLHAIVATAIADAGAGANSAQVAISGGNDGLEPTAGAYTTPADQSPFDQLARIDDISIVAAPGSTTYNATQALGIQNALVGHAEARRAYRIAVLDTAPDLTPAGALTEKAQFDSSYAGMYYPWVVVANPLARPDDGSIPQEIALPPSGFVCGIFARNDNTKGVAKSPANEIVRGALRYQTDVNFAEQELLNPRGVNCLRFFPGRGNRLWGARTTSSDPEWKYVGPRRYFLYLEHSIDRSTQWSVFENNGPRLWANIRETVSSFLYNEWVSGSLLGTNPDEAFFVRCDRTTMTQNDLDNGRLICQIGVAVLKPAEFVIFRIGQKTANARS
ncbi:hypothetical protein SAMN02745866_01752 [Alteromonadaceae bacterium Bs31]|nr:hypothetical protein SAMN02745866_01752 [Alteromonadaceae bacterium Bs31]